MAQVVFHLSPCANKFLGVLAVYQERAKISCPDIYGLVFAHDTKISVHYMGALKLHWELGEYLRIMGE